MTLITYRYIQMVKKSSKKSCHRKRVVDITLTILEEISRIVEVSASGVLDPHDLQKKSIYGTLESEKFFSRLRSVERRGYIAIDRGKVNQASISITNKGEIKLLESSIGNVIDGKWRIVSFDIPESLRNKRNSLRRIIKKLGFKQIQKSLWACPYNKADNLKLVFDDLKINKYVAYFIVEKTDIGDHLNRKFKISQ
jgi:CRISPR/Cas system-associated endoribonuclease Cas2